MAFITAVAQMMFPLQQTSLKERIIGGDIHVVRSETGSVVERSFAVRWVAGAILHGQLTEPFLVRSSALRVV